MGSHRSTWVVVFIRGQLSGQSFPFVSSRLRTRAVGGCTRADGRGFAGYRACACARGGSGCRCGHGRMLVVWLPRHPRRRGPCIRCERKKGEGCRDSPAYADGDDGKHRHRLDDVARCHVVACTLHRLSLWLTSAVVVVWVARDGGGWWVVAVGDGSVALVLGALLSIVAVCSLGSWLGVATSSSSSSSFSLVLVVSGRPYMWALGGVGSGW